MSSGIVKPFVDFNANNTNDTNENNAASIQPIADGESVNGTVTRRPPENLRLRTEALRGRQLDSMFLENADRVLLLTGPGKITWPGSTTASATGIPVISDTLYILPMLTPGFAQAAPVPPVASVFGTLHLKRASDSMNSILVTSQRRSYAAGDQINVTVSPGGAFSCVLDAEDTGALRRTIKIVATGSTTLNDVITALAALTPPAPDNTALVTAALEGGALGSDLILTTQAKQYVSGNYDGEGHAITPANLASFFSSNPTQALAEGDTLCVQFSMLYDTASNGGRRQAIPENSNTAVPAASFFNSRVHPENLFNALPICKVVNGNLVFGTGVEIPAGTSNAALGSVNTTSPFIRNGGFEHGNTNDTTRYGVTNWENRVDLAVNGAWRLGATAVDTGGKSLEFNKTSTSASVGRIEQVQEIAVTPGNNVKVSVRVKQLIAPTAGTYIVGLYWGDADSAASGSSSVAFQVLSTVDGAFRTVTGTVAVPAGKRFLKSVTVEVVNVTTGSTGVALAVDNLQVSYEGLSANDTKPIDELRMRPMVLDAVVLEDPTTYQLGQLAALLRFDKSGPAGEGMIVTERRDQTYPNLPPALAHYGRLFKLGAKLLDTEGRALLPRVSADISATAGVEHTLLWESALAGETVGGYTQPPLRIYASNDGRLLFVSNARYDGTNWNQDVAAKDSFRIVLSTETRFEWVGAGASPWAPGSWSLLSRNGVIGGSGTFEMAASNVLPATDGDRTVGSSVKAFAQMWTRDMRIGPAITDDGNKLVQYKSAFSYPTQTAQVDFDYISKWYGILSRKGHRFVQDWDSGTTTPGGWTTSTTGGAGGSATMAGAQHRVIVAHSGANAGTFSLRTIDGVKFRLTDGFVCRIRFNHYMGADFTFPRIGFYDWGGGVNGITFRPTVADGGGTHNYQFCVGAGFTAVGGPGDHAMNSGLRWLTMALVGTQLWWTTDYLNPDDFGSGTSDSFPISGRATITVPTGLYHFSITADGAGSGFGSSTTVDYVEIITGNRDA